MQAIKNEFLSNFVKRYYMSDISVSYVFYPENLIMILEYKWSYIYIYIYLYIYIYIYIYEYMISKETEECICRNFLNMDLLLIP